MLAVLTTHPIQYQVPIWRALAERGKVPLKVYYMSDQGLKQRHDPEFGRAIAWDIDLLSGYEHEFLEMKQGAEQSSFWWLRLNQDLGERLKREGATTLWLQGWQVAAYWQALQQARRAGLSTWLRSETNLRSTGKSRFSPIKGQLVRAYVRRFDRLLCIGEANRQFYLARGLPESRLASAPYCIDNARFSEAAEATRPGRQQLRAAWNIPQDAFCVLFMGKFIAKKRPLDLAAAVQAIASRNTRRPVHLLFVGSGELDEAVRTACNVRFDAHGDQPFARDGDATKPRASFAGFLNQSEIVKAYVAADCLALPSEATETWGLVVNEAMASGLPAVVSDACGCADDLIIPTRPDLCFPLGDTAALAQSLEACMAAPPQRADLARIIEGYDVMRTVETVEALYNADRLGARQPRDRQLISG